MEYGIHINGHQFRIDIEALLKTEETRARRTLNRYTDNRVGLIETGHGKAILWGFCKLELPTEYTTVKQFRDAYDVHRVEADSTYDIKVGGKKYGYPITDLVLLETPVELPSWTYTGNRTARVLPEEFTESHLKTYKPTK